MIENQETVRENIMKRPALPSSNGTSPGFLGMQNARRLEEQHNIRKKMGSIVRTKVKVKSFSPYTVSSDDSLASDVSSPWDASQSSESVASPLSTDTQSVSSPPPDDEDEEEHVEPAEKRLKTDSATSSTVDQETESVKSPPVSTLTTGSLVSCDYESSSSDDS